MSDILLNYINNNIILSKKVTNIELDFKKEDIFGELIEKALNLKSLNYISNPKTNPEILQNFETLEKNLKLIGISVNNNIIIEIIKGKSGAAEKLIYKIKIESNRKNINFNNILAKIHKNDIDREKEENKMNKVKIFSPKEKLINRSPMSSSFTSSGKLPNFTNFFKKKSNLGKDNKFIKSKELNDLTKIKPNIVNKNNRKNNQKFHFPKLKQGPANNFFNSTFQSYLKNNLENNDKAEESMLVKINEEEKDKNKIKDKDIEKEIINNNYYLSTGFSNKQMRKTKSLFEYDRVLQDMKSNI